MSDNKKLDYNEIFQKDIENIQDELGITSINEELEIPEIKVTVDIKCEPIESDGDEKDFSNDVQYLRGKLLHSVGKADQILESLLKKIRIDDEMDLAQPNSSKSYYRYYEVSAQLLKSICDASRELVNLHASSVKIKKDMNWLEVKSKEEAIEKIEKTRGNLREIVNNIRDIKAEDQSVNNNEEINQEDEVKNHDQNTH